MQVKSKSGRVFALPSDVEDASIRVGIAVDANAREVGLAEMRTMHPLRGRPPVTRKRPTLNMRIDPDVLIALRASGKGWQTKVNALLREAVQQGRLQP